MTSRGDRHHGPRLRILGPADRLGEGEVLGHGDGAARQVAGHQRRQPATDPGRADGRRRTGPQERGHHEGQEEVDDVGVDAPEGTLQDRPGEHRHRGDAAAPTGGDGAVVLTAGDLPAGRLDRAAAVEGKSRHQVEQGRGGAGLGDLLDRHLQHAVGRHEPQPQRRGTHRERGDGAHDRDHELLPRLLRLSLDGGHAAEEVQGDRADREPVVARHVGVRRLVQQH